MKKGGFQVAVINKRKISSLEKRFVVLFFFLCIAFLLLIFRLASLQLLHGEDYLSQTKDNVIAEKLIPSIRGKVLDINGRPLATNRPSYSIYADMRGFELEEQGGALKRVLHLSDEEFEKITKGVTRAQKKKRRGWIRILEDQSRERAALLKQEQQLFKSLEVRDEPFREYPEGKTLSHLIGYLSKINPKQLEKLRSAGYRDNDRIGRSGVERLFEERLKGKRGLEKYIVNAKGQRIDTAESKTLIEGPAWTPPQPGLNVHLTVDLDLQKSVEKELLKVAAGAVMVVDVKNGKVLAIASSPGFDSNEMSGKLSQARYNQLLTDPRKPFVDKTRKQHYPPGSTFKFIAALAAYEDGHIDHDTELSCGGRHKQGKRMFRCHKHHGKLNVVEAIRHSCNIFFWKLSEKIGLDRMAELARLFGFGEPSDLDLGGDVKGNIPTKEWYKKRNYFRIGHTLNAAVGQGDVEVTVVQLAMAYAALANHGYLWQPQVVDKLSDDKGVVVESFEPSLRRRIPLSEEALGAVHRGMDAVVNHKKGTGYKYAKSERVRFSGKSGTAQVRSFKDRRDDDALRGWDSNRDHAWFAGFAPSENPEIAFAVLIEHGGSGGKNAGPIAKALVDAYFSKDKSLDEEEPTDD